MLSENDKEVSDYYTAIDLPLTNDDKYVIKKSISTYWSANIILLPLLAIIFFWGLLYFCIFLVFALWYNISAAATVNQNELSMNNCKTVLTGKLTGKGQPVDGGTIIFFGPDKFDITYANSPFKFEIGDVVSLHYSQIRIGKRGILLKVEKQNQ